MPLMITGASGFIGASFAIRHWKAGHQVIAVTGPSGRSWRLDAAGFPAELRVSADLTDRAGVGDLLSRLRPSAIANFAVYGHYPEQTDVDLTYRVCLDTPRFLLEESRALGLNTPIVHAGSASEYGFNCSGTKEDAICLPDSHYSVAKGAATSLIRYFGGALGYPCWCLRLFAIYGPWQDPGRLISRLVTHAMRGGYPPLTDPGIARDFTHVDDVLAAFDRVLELAGKLRPGGVYNAGTGKMTRFGELVERVRALYGLERAPSWGGMPPREGDRRDWYADSTLACRELGWEARIPLEKGLADTARWIERAVERGWYPRD